MTPIAELLLQGGSRCLALHLEVPCLWPGRGQLGWTSGAEPVVHKDKTGFSLQGIKPAALDGAGHALPFIQILRPLLLAPLASGLLVYFSCPDLFRVAFALKISQTLERCAEETQKYVAGHDSSALFSQRRLPL